MLSAQAYTFGKKARLAMSLAWVGGFVDAVGFIELSIYTSNMTGNTAMIGQRLAEGGWRNVLYVYFLVCMFLAGAMLAGVLIESARRAKYKYLYTTSLALEALLLILTVAYVATGGQNLYLRGMLPCIAMGLQNATITRISGAVVRTTHVTGIVTDIGLETVQFFFWLRDKALRKRLLTTPTQMAATTVRFARITQRHPTFQRLLLLCSIWSTFVIGAGLGAYVWRSFGLNALLLPACFLLLMIVLERITPLASIDAVDRAARAKAFLAYGIEPDLVPETIGVYEIGNQAGRGHADNPIHQFAGADGTDTHKSTRRPKSPSLWTRRLRAPDLGDLHSMLKPQERVAILMLSPELELDANALAGLHGSLLVLRDRGRDLILCPATSTLYNAIATSPLFADLGQGNLCSDPEFAVARAMDLILPSGFSDRLRS